MEVRTAGTRSSTVVCGLAALFAIVVALAISLDVVSGLRWPYDGDHFRDIAQAQVARDGHPLSDPHYAGELFWYNPLVSWVVAGGSAALRMPPDEFHVRGGPWLNLIAPVGFYLVALELTGAPAALVALVVFLFFNAWTEPALTVPTYSPWLFVATFAQGLFYIAVLVLARARQSGTIAGAAWVGALAGLTFLAHTGPALVLGLIALFTLSPRQIATAGGVALIVASPFLYAIVWRYHLHVVNPTPMAWQWIPVMAQNLPRAIVSNAALFAPGLAALALVRHRVARAWLLSAALLYAYAASRDIAPIVPALVPEFHFWRYLLAALTMLTGASVWWGCRRAAGRFALPALVALLAVLVAWRIPGYRVRFDFTYGRSLALARDPSHAQMTQFLHRSTSRDAVILGSRGASLQIIGPAGRHVVAVNANWSNPYVDTGDRTRDRDVMIAALNARDEATFAPLAARYGVTHVVGVGGDECAAMADSPSLHQLTTLGQTCAFVHAQD